MLMVVSARNSCRIAIEATDILTSQNRRERMMAWGLRRFLQQRLSLVCLIRRDGLEGYRLRITR